jgi:hypothetical protein
MRSFTCDLCRKQIDRGGVYSISVRLAAQKSSTQFVIDMHWECLLDWVRAHDVCEGCDKCEGQVNRSC